MTTDRRDREPPSRQNEEPAVSTGDDEPDSRGGSRDGSFETLFDRAPEDVTLEDVRATLAGIRSGDSS